MECVYYWQTPWIIDNFCPEYWQVEKRGKQVWMTHVFNYQ